MKVTYQDNSIQEFFVWIESDGDIVIAKASDETHGEGYDLREDNSKKSFSFSKRHPSNNYTIDEIYSKKSQFLCNRRLTLSFIIKIVSYIEAQTTLFLRDHQIPNKHVRV